MNPAGRRRSSKAFQRFVSRRCSTSVPLRRGSGSGSGSGRGPPGGAGAGEPGRRFSKCPCAFGQRWIPSVPLRTLQRERKKERKPLHADHTTDLYQTQLQYVFSTFVHYLVQRKKQEKCFLECLCMNLNFKLFVLFFLKHRPILRETKLCKYLIYFISRKRFMCGHSIKSNVLD